MCDSNCPARALFRQMVRERLKASGVMSAEVEAFLPSALHSVDTGVLSQHPAFAQLLATSRKDDALHQGIEAVVNPLWEESEDWDTRRRQCFRIVERIVRNKNTQPNVGRLLTCLLLGASFACQSYPQSSARRSKLKAFLEDCESLIDEGFHILDKTPMDMFVKAPESLMAITRSFWTLKTSFAVLESLYNFCKIGKT